jgi:hypothetical protein
MANPFTPRGSLASFAEITPTVEAAQRRARETESKRLTLRQELAELTADERAALRAKKDS